MGGIDLHVHTTASDGAFTPSQVVEGALAKELTHLAITDHDTTAGIDGTYFLIDNSGNMTPETSNNSTRTTGTSYTLSVDTVYKAQIWWNTSTSVVFKITNMDESTTHASETISTNLPSSTARRFGAGLVTKSSGTAIDNLLVLDYMGWGLYPYREDDSV